MKNKYVLVVVLLASGSAWANGGDGNRGNPRDGNPDRARATFDVSKEKASAKDFGLIKNPISGKSDRRLGAEGN
ncbi:MAG: hypothetical protein AB7P04_11780 [Bacteriovoracia bacterium]